MKPCATCGGQVYRALGICAQCGREPGAPPQCPRCACALTAGCVGHRQGGPWPMRLYPCPDCQPSPSLARAMEQRAAQAR